MDYLSILTKNNAKADRPKRASYRAAGQRAPSQRELQARESQATISTKHNTKQDMGRSYIGVSVQHFCCHFKIVMAVLGRVASNKCDQF